MVVMKTGPFGTLITRLPSSWHEGANVIGAAAIPLKKFGDCLLEEP